MAKAERRAFALSEEYDPPVTAAFWREWLDGAPNSAVLPRIVLHGGYGKRNLGDDAILHVLLAQLGEALPAAKIEVLCHGPREVASQYKVVAHHFASVGALRAILAANLYIIGGGGIINRINVYSGWRRWRVLDPKGKFLFFAALLAKAHRAKVIFHAIGATSVPDPVVGWLARVTLNRMDYVSVRDPLSRDVLRRLGVRRDMQVVPDPAFSLEAIPSEAARAILRQEGLDPDAPLIGLNFRPVAEPDIRNAETADTVAGLADWLAESYQAQVCFLPFGRHPSKPVEDDVSFAREVQKRVRRPGHFHVLARPCMPPEMKGLLAEMDFCLLERLHAVILAVSVGTPFLAISYDDKVSELVRAVGLADRIVPLREFELERAKREIQRLFPLEGMP